MATEEKTKTRPNAYRVEDTGDLKEKDLETHYLFGKGETKSATGPGMEGQGMGGEHFGENNLTQPGNDKANPPQNAGEGNAYFNRNEPAEEHPENENFVTSEQQGEPNIPGPNELPHQQNVGEDKAPRRPAPNPQEEYWEGTADSDGK